MKMPILSAIFALFLGLPEPSKAKPGNEIYQKGFLSIEEARKSIELPDLSLIHI